MSLVAWLKNLFQRQRPAVRVIVPARQRDAAATAPAPAAAKKPPTTPAAALPAIDATKAATPRPTTAAPATPSSAASPEAPSVEVKDEGPITTPEADAAIEAAVAETGEVWILEGLEEGPTATLADRTIEVATAEEAGVIRRIAERLEGGKFDTPVLPDTLLRVMDLANKPDASVTDIAECIKTDAVIASEVLSLVNSAAYLPAQPIRDIHRAIVHVGVRRVRTLMFGVVARLSVFRKTDAARGQQLWVHSLGTAVLAREIARPVPYDPEEAFLAGLLHDIGKTVILGLVATAERESRMRIPNTLVWKLLDEAHTAVGSRVAAAWRLTGPLAEAIEFHHKLQPTTGKLAAVTALANDVAGALGVGVPRRKTTFRKHPAFEILGLREQAGLEMLTKLPAVLAQAPELKEHAQVGKPAAAAGAASAASKR
ncbi:MAG TPA: HDOD domain-containing protein [Planctomycetota bacterium]|nr:HDOD domain-containing protein [Planctomycetota bacterium]